MSKKSKLTEKPVRMPDIKSPQYEQAIRDYLNEIKIAESENAKSACFYALIKKLFGFRAEFIEKYLKGIEKSVKAKEEDYIVRGQIDNLFGNLIIEFERDLNKKLSEAVEQLRRYTYILWHHEQEESHSRTPYMCVATDGINFVIYSPVLRDPSKGCSKHEDVDLKVIEKVNWLELEPEEIYLWLDRYFLRNTILPPKTENIVKDFGINSHAFQTTFQILFSTWQRVKNQSDFEVVYNSWRNYLQIVYGLEIINEPGTEKELAEEELFCRHTYLATLAKLMVWSRLGGDEVKEGQEEIDSDENFSDRQSYDEQIIEVISGQYFKRRGIENFIEEDFFSWITREDVRQIGLEISRKLLSLLKAYNLRELSEDVFKSLYQELVHPKTRHNLGEFYTPDWLAHKIILTLLKENPEASILDPACGSGTFLYVSIKEKREKLSNSSELLKHILNSVVGIDIHPLAVIIAKTNYILALGDLIKKRKETISIPIYLADGILPPEKWIEDPGADYPVEINNKQLIIPKDLLNDTTNYDRAIDLAREFAKRNVYKNVSKDQFRSYLKNQKFSLAKKESIIKNLFEISMALKEFIENRKDTIWAFVLKNIYKPLFFKRKFDFVVGNPPWLSLRYAEQKYQKKLKNLVVQKYDLLSGRGELITHIELGTLFLLRTADLYLKDGGKIVFVLPRSIFSSDQHDGLRKGTFIPKIKLKFEEVWDLGEVEPLFNVPACVLVARKTKDAQISYPIPGYKISGKLESKNASLLEAESHLKIEEVEFYLHKIGKRSYWNPEKPTIHGKASYYKELFKQGATIVPRSFWFVDIKPSPLGFDPSSPPIETSRYARKKAKDAYKDVIMKGNIKSRFLYVTLLSSDLFPFGYLRFRLVVLPIEPDENNYKLINSYEARKRGFLNLAEWLEKVEEEWEGRRGKKAKGISALEWLDYRHKLTSQNPHAKYKVLYTTSATFLTSCVVKNEKIEFDIGGQKVQTQGFVADAKTYYFESEDEGESFYLSAILNSPFIDKLIKPMQSRGKFGERDIHKKPLDLPIPRFNPSDSNHLRLSELGRECHKKVNEWLASGGPGKVKSIGMLRRRVRELLEDELKEIDAIVSRIITPS